MSKQQIIEALRRSAKADTMLDVITYLATTGSGKTRADAEAECLRIWKHLGGSDPV